MAQAARALRPRWSRAPALTPGPVTLTQRCIYILPTRIGMTMAAALVLMLLLCVNYNLSLGYILAFLLTGTSIVSLLHTYRNLVQLRIHAGRADNVFVGEVARFPVLLENRQGLPRRSIALRGGASTRHVDVEAGQWAQADLHRPALRRGRLPAGRFRLYTTFPLGLFRAWSDLELDLTCLVYPQPEQQAPAFPPSLSGDDRGPASGPGQDDFAGLRAYHAGDSLRQVAWKAFARDAGLLTKQFAGPDAGECWFDWDQLPASLGVEARLSRLARWIVDATQHGRTYGLRLPGSVIPAASGPTHETRCLSALALFDRIP